jgi:predicted ATPase
VGQLHPRIIELPPLSADAVGELVRDRLPGAVEAFQRACGDATVGNPFLLRELLAAVESMDIAADDEGARRVRELASHSVARWTRARLADLPAQAIALASAVAVLGDNVPLRRAAHLAGVSLAEARRSFDGLAAIQVLHDREPLRFVHPLIQSSIYADLPPGERLDAHRRAARMLADEGASLEQIAAHLLATCRGCGPLPPPRA